MAGVKNTKLFIVKISAKDKGNASASADRYFGSRSFFLSDIISDPPVGYEQAYIYGILREIQGLGQSMGEVMPDDKYGSIVLDATRGTTDFDKRFYDIFERETILHQTVVVYGVEVQDGQTTTLSTWETEFTGEVTSVQVDVQSKKMTINIKAKTVSYESPNYQITKVNFPEVGDSGSGRFLPLVFGRCKVPCYFLQSGTDFGTVPNDVITKTFAYATAFQNSDANKKFLNGSIVNRYSKTREGDYKIVVFPTANFADIVSLKILEPGGAALTDGSAGNKARELVQSDNSKNYIVTAALGVYWVNAASGTFVVNSVFEVYNRSPNAGLPINPAAASGGSSFTVDVADYGGASDFQIGAPALLKDPFFLYDMDKGYFFTGSITISPDGAAGFSKGLVIFDTNEVQAYRRIDPDNNTDQWIRDPSAYPKIGLVVYAVGRKGDVVLSTENYSFEVLKHYPFTGSFGDGSNIPYTETPVPPDVGKLDLVYEIDGLTTQSTFLTGTNGQLITRADHIVKLLYYLGNNYSLTGLDLTTFDAGTYAPNLAGVSEDRQTYRDMMVDILDNAAAKLVPRRSSNSLALWCYGVRQAVAGVITESDCRLTNLEVLGEDALTNRVKVNYNKSLIPLTGAAESKTNFQSSYAIQDDLSISLYGIRDLSQEFVELPYVQSDAAAQRWANYKLVQYSKERTFVYFTVPYWKENYRTFDLMDIIEICHIDNPSYFGSESGNAEIPITTAGASIDTDFMLGDVLRRARSNKVRILGRSPKYSINAEEAEIEFKALVLDNPDEITYT